MKPTLADAIAKFGKTAKDKLSNPAVTGQPEDQLRAPLEALIQDICAVIGAAADDVILVGETSLADLMTRPDYSVTRKGALTGHIEVKAPGKGADPRKFTDKHDKGQWEKLKALPNLIYTDGSAFSLWRDGELAQSIVRLGGDIETTGAALTGPDSLRALVETFLEWNPIPPRSPKELADTTARLCRLLRDEVVEQLDREAPALVGLREDWRQLLLPEATDDEFADGYAQAVTFGLLMAKARGIDLSVGLEPAARQLSQTNTLIGSALKLLTDPTAGANLLDTSIKTLVRVVDAVNWKTLTKGRAEPWLYFYEEFLQQYDRSLRKKTGSYYTPPEVVTEMVRLVDEALRAPGRFNLARGLASGEVSLADPAVGTGTFLLGVLNRIARTVEDEEGAGSVPAAIQAALKRLVGFELQFGPFAVAQLRLLAEVADLTSVDADVADVGALRLYITDTLADPDEETPWVPRLVEGIAESRRQANRVKRKEAITVVMGNPPYKEKAKGLGGWVEDHGGRDRAPLDDWQPPVAWRVGAHAKHLRNLYVYFWRWAAWKVFGGDSFRSGGDKEEARDWTKRQGIVCFITVAGFLNGPGFQKMRADLRRDADEIWVIDCSPEGHQAPVASRIFDGVQQPVCIVMALRRSPDSPPTPARVRFRALPEGGRKAKFEALAGIGLDDDGWTDAPTDPRAPFLAAGEAAWLGYPALEDLFLYNGSGVMAGRTWVIAPDAQSLKDRWTRLVSEKDATKKAVLFHPHMNGDRTLTKIIREALAGHPHPPLSVDADVGEGATPVRYGFRSFDRQWLLADNRLINRANPTLWNAWSNKQVHVTALRALPPQSGPGLTFTGLIPELDHYNGRGGRVFPLWADAATSQSNIAPGLLKTLGETYGQEVEPEDMLAYIAAVAAHPAYVARFRANLKQPGLRIPITADGDLFHQAATLGREVVWLHTFGERFAEGRPQGAPRVTDGPEPTIPKDGALPRTLAEMPHDLTYDAAERRLKIGAGHIDNVAPEVWAYEVSGKRVISQWWSYRRADRSKPPMGDKRPPSPLSAIQPTEWPAEYTTELLNVLRVLTRLVALEAQQADLLARIVEGATIDTDDLMETGALSDGVADGASEGDAGEGSEGR
ncbi:MAG: DNA methyltransferase [Caulobacterales bacterium 32-67-6]|nr:MAG: DNA methyltransferase [Caulobacterales bacterium 32-67-6]